MEAVGHAVSTLGAGDWLVVQDDGPTTTDYAQFVRQVVAALPSGTCLAWVEGYSYWRADQTAAIRNNIPIGLCFAMVPWEAAVLADGSLLQSDGLHPTAAGEAVLAALIADAVTP